MIFTSKNKTTTLQQAVQILIICLLSFLFYHTFVKSDKIAYVDSAKLLSEFKGSEAAKAQFQFKAKTWQSNVDTLTGELKNLIGKYEKSLATMPEHEQKLAKELIDNKKAQLANYQHAVQQSAGEENQKLTQVVVNQINTYLNKYGKSHRYQLILIANPSGTIAYGREGTDITATVLNGLNKDYKQTSNK